MTPAEEAASPTAAPMAAEPAEAPVAEQAEVAIGTHALFQDAVRFDRLALAVIDEQHRFGVSERQRLQAKGDPRLGADAGDRGRAGG